MRGETGEQQLYHVSQQEDNAAWKKGLEIVGKVKSVGVPTPAGWGAPPNMAQALAGPHLPLLIPQFYARVLWLSISWFP